MESIKLTVIGTPQCGKTSLIHRFVYAAWVGDEKHTTTAELYSITMSRGCILGIWDTGRLKSGKVIYFSNVCFRWGSITTPQSYHTRDEYNIDLFQG